MNDRILLALSLTAGLTLTACGDGTQAKPDSSAKPAATSTAKTTAAATASAKPTAEPEKGDGW